MSKVAAKRMLKGFNRLLRNNAFSTEESETTNFYEIIVEFPNLPHKFIILIDKE